MKLINADKVIKTLRARKKLFCKNQIEFRMLPPDQKARVDEIDTCIAELVNAEEVPPAQPEIVRCKDCKYWNSGSCEYPEHAVNCQDYWVGDIETEAEHFCGNAKRREVTA